MSDFAPYMFKYFWFIGAIVGMVNMLIIWIRVNPKVKAKPELKEDAQKLLLGLFIVMVLSFFILGVLQILGGFSNMFFIFSNDISNVYLIISWVFMTLVYGVVLFWFYFRDAARIVLLFREQMGNIPNNEPLIKMFILMMICAGTAAIVFGAIQDIYNAFPFFR